MRCAIRFYISHSIRGKYGNNATNTQMKENCDAIKMIAIQLQNTFPLVDFYVPAHHEDFVQNAYASGYITERQILDVDCMIITQTCDAVIIYVPEGDELQGGRKIEYDHAVKLCIPVVIFHKTQQAIEWLTHFILHS